MLIVLLAAGCIADVGNELEQVDGGDMPTEVLAKAPSCDDCGASISHADCHPPFTDNCQQRLPGVRIMRGRAFNRTDFVATFIDLCADGVHVTATEPASNFRTTSSWAYSVGVQLAVNGDFFKSGPRVYGNAVGGGIAWPLDQTGNDPQYSYEWFYQKHGWIAFGPDRVWFNHTERTKKKLDPQYGWIPDQVTAWIPNSATALVSGFPELVVEGRVHECPDTGDCFPDRGDMRDRHPRTAMGLSSDLGTFMLVVVDGRASGQAGLRGIELAELMDDLGAWQAFNLDGGGSSELYFDGKRLMAPGGQRPVANHWGVYAGPESGMPETPGHCMASCPIDGATCRDTFGYMACEGETGFISCLSDGIRRCTCGANGTWTHCAAGCIF